MSDFTKLPDLVSERLGGRVLLANDEFFAPKENLLKPEKPIYIEGKYTEFGKWMDGWETRRRRTPGYDWCILQLGLPGILRGMVVETTHFKGNHPEHCSLEACAVEDDRAAELIAESQSWTEIIPKSPLQGDSANLFAIENAHRYTHLRFKIYPDGGVARLRVHGDPLLDWRSIPENAMDLASALHGARVIACSDEFFSAPQNLLMPGDGVNMGDGWETRRRRGPGHDWVVIRLAIAGMIQRVEVSTAHFKGNFPESFSLEGCTLRGEDHTDPQNACWEQLLPRTPLRADALHVYELSGSPAATHVRFNIFPDGGVSRLRIYGVPTRDARIAEGLRLFDALPDSEARSSLISCCGSAKWAEQILRQRPYRSPEHLRSIADATWDSLGREDWLEAFSHHPEIGSRKAAITQSEQARRWSMQEQAQISHSSASVLAELERANPKYAERFGHIFLSYASGRGPQEVLADLQQRLANDPATEFKVAAEEQRRIMQHRLGELLGL